MTMSKRSIKLAKRMTPPWQTPAEKAAIQQFHRQCPAGHMVEPIIPLEKTPSLQIVGIYVLGNLGYRPVGMDVGMWRAQQMAAIRKPS